MLSTVVFYYKDAYFDLKLSTLLCFLSENWNIHQALNITGIPTLPYPVSLVFYFPMRRFGHQINKHGDLNKTPMLQKKKQHFI